MYPRISPPAGDTGHTGACWEQKRGWQSAAAFFSIRLLGSRREILRLGTLPCPACVVLYLWAERKHSLLHIISLDQQEKKAMALGGTAGRGGRREPRESSLAGGSKAATRQIPPAPAPCCIVGIGAAVGLRLFPKPPGFPQQPRYWINRPPSPGCTSLPSPSPAPSLQLIIDRT